MTKNNNWHTHIADTFGLGPMSKTLIMIDGKSHSKAAKGLKFNTDYAKLRHYFASTTDLIRASYYTVLQESFEDNPVVRLLDWLSSNGFTVKTRIVKHGDRSFKIGMGADIACDMMRLPARVDCLILFSGEGELVTPLEAVKEMGIRTIVVSDRQTNPIFVSEDLRKTADVYVDLLDLITYLGADKTSTGAASKFSDNTIAWVEPE